MADDQDQKTAVPDDTDDDNQSMVGDAVKTARAALRGSFPVGRAALKAGDEAWQEYHGGGPQSLAEGGDVGGAVDDGSSDQTQAPSLDDAMNTVEKVLQYGRQLHGLGGQEGGADQDQEGGADQDQGGAIDDGAQSFEGGGAVDDNSDQGESWEPPAEDAQTEPQAAVPDDQPSMTDSQGPQSSLDQGANKIASYVQGAGALAHTAAKSLISKAAQMFHTDDPDEAKLAAFSVPGVDDATGWGLMQYYRQAYDNARGYAAVAATGTQQKPANLEDSVKAANDAFSHVPDGTHTEFQVAPGGQSVVMSVSKVGDRRPFLQQPLPVQQYQALLKSGDFDTLLENGPQAALQKAQQAGQQQQQAGPQSGAPPNADQSQMAQMQPQPFQAPTSAGVQNMIRPPMAPQPPGPGAPGGPPSQTSMFPKKAAPTGHENDILYTPAGGATSTYIPKELDAQARAIFGSSINAAPKRMQWITQQMQQNITNQINQTKANNPYGVQMLRNQGSENNAKIKSEWEDRRTQSTMMLGLDKLTQQKDNAQLSAAAGVMKSMLVGGVDPSKADDVFAQMTGGHHLSQFIDFANKPAQPASTVVANPAGKQIQQQQTIQAAQQGQVPPQQAIQYLKQNPQMAQQFDQKYGQGAANRYLAGQ